MHFVIQHITILLISINSDLFENKQKEQVDTYLKVTNAALDSPNSNNSGDSQQSDSKKPPSPKQKNDKNGKAKSSMSNVNAPEAQTQIIKINPNLKALHTLSTLSKYVSLSSVNLSGKQLFMHINQLRIKPNEVNRI